MSARTSATRLQPVRGASVALAMLAAAVPVTGAAQDLPPDTTRAYTTIGMSNELTDNRVLMETGLAVGRMHRLGGRGQWTLRSELGLGLVDTFEGYRAYGSLAAWGGRAWSQSLFRFSERFRARPSITVGGGLYRFDGGGAIPGDAWVPIAGLGVGLEVLEPPRRGGAYGTLTSMHIVREERLASGADDGRWFLRITYGMGTSPDHVLPERAPPAWWEREAPDIPRGSDRRRPLPRPELPHHVYGYWAEDLLPGVRRQAHAEAPDMEGSDTLALGPHRGPAMGAWELRSYTLDMARRRLERSPGNAYAIHDLGALLAERGRYAEALRAFSRALEASETGALRAMILTDIGTTWAGLGYADSALIVWRSAMIEGGATPAAAMNAGVLLEELGRRGEALDWYRAAAERSPALAAPWENLAYALVRHGWLEEAVGPLRRALILREGSEGIHLIRWKCHDLALFLELTGEPWEDGTCDRTGRVTSPGLLPEK